MKTVTKQATPIRASVEVRRTLEDVFHFYQNFENLPQFLGDVMEVEITGPTTSRWTIEGPFGIRVHWNIEVVELLANRSVRYQLAGSEIAHAVWTVSFSRGITQETTIVDEVLEAPLDRVELVLMALIGKFPSAEVQANLQRLKQLLETGLIRETQLMPFQENLMRVSITHISRDNGSRSGLTPTSNPKWTVVSI